MVGIFLALIVQAAPSFKVYENSIPLTKQSAVLEATNEFMKSAKGKSYKGGFHINAILTNGGNRANHSCALLMPSLSDIADWKSSLAGDPEIAKFWKVLDEHSTLVSEYMGSLIKAKGDVSNDDRLWLLTRFKTTDPMSVVTVKDKMIKSERGKFPGQVVLHSISAGNRNGANNDYSTHMFVIGYESVAEMKEWTNHMNEQPAWAEYLASLRHKVVRQGSELIQNAVI